MYTGLNNICMIPTKLRKNLNVSGAPPPNSWRDVSKFQKGNA